MTRRAFTLIELLVTIAVIGVMTSILLPAVGTARETARGAACLSNLRQFSIALNTYADDYAESCAPAQYGYYGGVIDPVTGRSAVMSWDFITVRVGSTAAVHRPGILFQSGGAIDLQQCPSYDGNANWQTNGVEDPATGYNYNTSYLGGPTEPIGGWVFFDRSSLRQNQRAEPARLHEVRDPARTAAFGDGGFRDGANKFMRSPLEGPRDLFIDRVTAAAGAQAFRHGERTNAAYVDGHAESHGERAVTGDAAIDAWLGDSSGFLSEDNAAYRLNRGRDRSYTLCPR